MCWQILAPACKSNGRSVEPRCGVGGVSIELKSGLALYSVFARRREVPADVKDLMEDRDGFP
jgi:hypothetical protein